MKHQIKSFFPDAKSLSINDILEYAGYNIEDYALREIVSETYWRVEAIFSVFKDNKSFKVIFNDDVVSPYRNYSPLEVGELFKKLDEQFTEVRKVII
ncbi:hypothetical protein HGB13_00040 [bacterium]|nr:hypothetical protein [bacterium]